MNTIIITYFVFICFDFLAKEKLKLQERGLNQKSKLIYRLCKCDFCFEFWVGVSAVLFIASILGFSKIDFITPFVIAGINQTFKKIKI